MRSLRQMKAIKARKMREQKRIYKRLLRNELNRKLIHFHTLSHEERELYIECESNDIAVAQEKMNRHQIHGFT